MKSEKIKVKLRTKSRMVVTKTADGGGEKYREVDKEIQTLLTR